MLSFSPGQKDSDMLKTTKTFSFQIWKYVPIMIECIACFRIHFYHFIRSAIICCNYKTYIILYYILDINCKQYSVLYFFIYIFLVICYFFIF